MTDEELRLGAIELLLIELIPWLDPEAVNDARRAIQDGLDEPVSTDEATMRRHALSIIEDGQKRYVNPLPGLFVRPPKS